MGDPICCTGPQQRLVDHLFANLPVQDLIRPGGDLPRRHQQRDTPGLVFGPNGTNMTQTRGMIEVGILF